MVYTRVGKEFAGHTSLTVTMWGVLYPCSHVSNHPASAGRRTGAKPWFSGALLKLDRAKAHIADFDAAATRFLNSNRDTAWPEIDPVMQRHGYTSLEVLCDDPLAPLDLQMLCEDMGHRIEAIVEIGGEFHFAIAVEEGRPTRSWPMVN